MTIDKRFLADALDEICGYLQTLGESHPEDPDFPNWENVLLVTKQLVEQSPNGTIDIDWQGRQPMNQINTDNIDNTTAAIYNNFDLIHALLRQILDT